MVVKKQKAIRKAEYATNIEQCNSACHHCGMLGVRKFDEHNCMKKGRNIFAKWNPENPLHTTESRAKYCKDNGNSHGTKRQPSNFKLICQGRYREGNSTIV